MLFYICYVLAILPIVLMFPTKIINRKNLPKRGTKAIFTSNHYSNLDPVVLDAFLARKLRFMGKKELFEKKVPAFFLKQFGGFPVDREKMSPSSYKTAMGFLQKNKQLLIFPEGTRNKSGSKELLEIKSGFLMFASRGDTAITPVLLYRKPKLFRKNYIIVGEPFELVGENPKRLTKEELEENLERYLTVLSQLRIELDEIVEGKRKNKKSSKKVEKSNNLQ